MNHARSVVNALVPVNNRLPSYWEESKRVLKPGAPAHMHIALGLCKTVMRSVANLVVRCGSDESLSASLSAPEHDATEESVPPFTRSGSASSPGGGSVARPRANSHFQYGAAPGAVPPSGRGSPSSAMFNLGGARAGLPTLLTSHGLRCCMRCIRNRCDMRDTGESARCRRSLWRYIRYTYVTHA